MCIILDVHKVDFVLGNATSYAEKVIARRILKRSLGLAAGGTRYFREMSKSVSQDGQQFFVELWRNPDQPVRADLQLSSQVDAEEQRLIDRGVCESCDEHIIAIALLTGARLLFSGDLPLGRDFRNRKIVDPPGRVVPEDADRRQVEQLLDRDPVCSPQSCGRKARRGRSRR